MTIRLSKLAVTILLLSFFLAVFAARPTAAQPRWSWPEKSKNLKVLPKDTPPEKLRAVMTGFTRSLGVRCSHCHVGEEGKPLDTYDFASDKNPKKAVARGMLKMLGNVNKELKSIQPAKAERVNMWCHTCHHGRPVPMTLAEELTRVYAAAGTDSTIAHYRALRGRFYGSAAYDFREGSLLEVADGALQKKDPRGAIAILNLDAEFYPESGSVHEALGEAYLAAADTAQAIVHYEKSVAVEPRNQGAKKMLETLRGGGR
ncbi:MAG TPA: c-type cytochrome [Candidatus Eisenbacteria bacterium]|nr:c-type cytochrome [Candidatus Eisenbacteria bacterium]